ncbi:MAG: hypothetical protein HY925_07270 [Elusimicrobia bacterium]|nr:hypothetical protein [Elusimicrobiota bacterium]
MTPWLLAAGSGLALFAASSPVSCWPLVFVALAPLLYAARGAKDARQAANLGAVAGLCFYVPALHWLTKVCSWAAGPFWCLFALWVAFFAASYRELVVRTEKRRWAPAAETLGAAALWIAFEYFRSEVWRLECSWLALGYALKPFPPLLQGASLLGVYGLSGLIVFANAAWVAALSGRRGPAIAITAAVISLGLWGGRRLERIDAGGGRRVAAALVQDENFDVDKLIKATPVSEVRGGLWVWPEYGFTAITGHERAQIQSIAKRLGGPASTLVAGGATIPDETTGRLENFAWVIGEGRLLGRYDKSHPIPFIEDKHLRPNPAPRPVDSPLGRLGVLLCYDLDFEDSARLMASFGAEALVVPNLDPREWGPWQHRQHSDMAPLRAVETGLWIARAASSGHSQLIDPGGRVRAESSFGAESVLTGDLEFARASTVYTRIGWLLAPVCLALAGAFLVWAAAARFGKIDLK